MMRYLKLAFYAVCLFCCLPAAADTALTVTPYQEGRYFRFGVVNSSTKVSREAKVEMTSTDGKRYQVFQEMSVPLANESGEPLAEGAFAFYVIRDSNVYGTLFSDPPHPVSVDRDLLYMSSNDGVNDSFDIVYYIDGSKVNASGHFYGRILYTLESEGSSGPVRVFVDVDFDVSRMQSSVSLKNSRGGDVLRIDTSRKEKLSDYLICDMNLSQGRNIRIDQRFEMLPVNTQGTALPEGILKFFIPDAAGGRTYNNPVPVGFGTDLIYSGAPPARESFKIEFFIDENDSYKIEAGLYRGTFVYVFESDDLALNETIPISIEIDVAKRFNMEIVQPEELTFPDIKPNTPPQERALTIKVNSNLGKQYQVIQTMPLPMVDESGKEIPPEFFTSRQELSPKSSGEVSSAQFSPVKPGDELIFTSDPAGSPAEIAVIYRLTPSLDIPPGNYKTQIFYSLLER